MQAGAKGPWFAARRLQLGAISQFTPLHGRIFPASTLKQWGSGVNTETTRGQNRGDDRQLKGEFMAIPASCQVARGSRGSSGIIKV